MSVDKFLREIYLSNWNRRSLSYAYSLPKGLLLTMSHVYVGNLNARVSELKLENEFRTYRVISRIWVARKPPVYAYIDFDDYRDAQDVIHDLNGKYN